MDQALAKVSAGDWAGEGGRWGGRVLVPFLSALSTDLLTSCLVRVLSAWLQVTLQSTHWPFLLSLLPTRHGGVEDRDQG